MAEAKTNGILKGYTVYYTIIRRGAEDVAEVEKSVTASKYSARVLLTGIQPYTQVKIEVAAFTIAGEGPKSPSVFVGMSVSFQLQLHVGVLTKILPCPYKVGFESTTSGLVVRLGLQY